MFWPKNLLPDPERCPKGQFGNGVLAHGVEQGTQVIEVGRRFGMFWPKDLLPNAERFLKEWFGFGVLTDLSEKEPEHIQGICSLGMLRTPSALCHFNHSFLNGNRLLIFSLLYQLVYLLIQCIWIIVFGQRS